MQVRRLGGAYGGKISLPNAIATACAVAAEKLRKPVRLTLDLQTNMELLGKRSPYLFQYSATVDENNKLVDVNSNIYADVGFSGLAPDAAFVPPWFQNCYSSSKWTCKPVEVQTNLPTNTACRAPSSTQVSNLHHLKLTIQETSSSKVIHHSFRALLRLKSSWIILPHLLGWIR